MSKEKENTEKGHGKPVLHLIINEKNYEWAEQYITGGQIRKLANIPKEEEIFLSIKKPWDDEPVPDDARVDLARPGIEHFYSKCKVQYIVVNGTRHDWPKEKISFVEVIKLAFGVYHDNPNWIYTVGYEDGPKQNPEGSMIKGQEVYVKCKMIFHVKATDQS